MSSRVLAYQGQTCTQISKHMFTELGCNYPQAKSFTPEAFKGVGITGMMSKCETAAPRWQAALFSLQVVD